MDKVDNLENQSQLDQDIEQPNKEKLATDKLITPIANDVVTRRQVIISLAAATIGTMLRPSGVFSVTPPKKLVRFAVLGDWGIGTIGQLNIARQMIAAHKQKAIDFVLTTGDNIYPYGESRYFNLLFERPYAGLHQDRVKFYASLGNHDIIAGRQAQLSYPLFNMGGKNYYSMAQGDGLAEFFVLDSNYFDNAQAGWLESGLKNSRAKWKILSFHHPIYSSARSHGSDLILRRSLEPLLVRYKVNVVFAGHDHTYERVKPQQGVRHFVTGGGGFVRIGDINPQTNFRETSYDQGNHFMLVEINDRQLQFQAIGENGAIIDSGFIKSA